MDPFSNPRAFLEKIERYLVRVSELGRGGEYVTYAIRDPRYGDPRDPSDCPPFYVGQTSHLGRRARQHLRSGGGSRTKGGNTAASRIYSILAAGKLPIFEVLERAETRAASLQSETRWAQKLRQDGFDLVNQWGEHKAGAPSPVMVPAKRLWNFTLEQAENDGIEIDIHCGKCGLKTSLPLGEVIRRSRSTISLAVIRKAVSCPKCNHHPCMRLRRRSPRGRSDSELQSAAEPSTVDS